MRRLVCVMMLGLFAAGPAAAQQLYCTADTEPLGEGRKQHYFGSFPPDAFLASRLDWSHLGYLFEQQVEAEAGQLVTATLCGELDRTEQEFIASRNMVARRQGQAPVRFAFELTPAAYIRSRKVATAEAVIRIAHEMWSGRDLPRSSIPPQITSRSPLLQTLLTQLAAPGGLVTQGPPRVRTTAWRTGSYTFEVQHGDGVWFRWTFETARDEISAIRYGPRDGEERRVLIPGVG